MTFPTVKNGPVVGGYRYLNSDVTAPIGQDVIQNADSQEDAFAAFLISRHTPRQRVLPDVPIVGINSRQQSEKRKPWQIAYQVHGTRLHRSGLHHLYDSNCQSRQTPISPHALGDLDGPDRPDF